MGETDWKLGLVLMGRTMLSKSLIQFSVDGWGCVPFLLFTWGQTMVEVMKIMVTSVKRSQACISALLHSEPPTLQQATIDHASARDSWTLTGRSASVSCGVTAPFSWVLVHTRFCLCKQTDKYCLIMLIPATLKSQIYRAKIHR